MTSYLANQEDIDNLLSMPNMRDQSGIMFSYVTDPNVLAKIVPKPLKVISPIIAGYITHIGKPTFAKPYNEAVLYAMVNHGGVSGAYPFTLLLSGPGAEEAMIAGREGASMPKKLADKITITKSDSGAHASVIRHNVKLIDVSFTPGKPNDPEIAKQIMSAVGGEIGKPTETASLFINYDLKPKDDGSNEFSNTELISVLNTGVYSNIIPGSLEIKLNSSVDDPVGELKVVKPVAAAWYQMDYSKMHKTIKLADLNAQEVAPFLFTGNYDRSFIEADDTDLTY